MLSNYPAFIPHGLPRRGNARSCVRNVGFRCAEAWAISVAPHAPGADHQRATHQRCNDLPSSFLGRTL
jgi:hypothetical protein